MNAVVPGVRGLAPAYGKGRGGGQDPPGAGATAPPRANPASTALTPRTTRTARTTRAARTPRTTRTAEETCP